MAIFDVEHHQQLKKGRWITVGNQQGGYAIAGTVWCLIFRTEVFVRRE